MGSNPPPTGSNSPTARVDVSVDKLTLDTELKTSNPITVTVRGSGGFSGPVNLTATVVDSAGAALPGWTVALSAPTVTLTADGTGTATAMVTVPPMSTGLTGSLKVTSSSSAGLGTNAATSTITAAKTVTFNIKVDATGKCVYPADAGTVANPVTVALGTKIRFFNSGTANFEIHSNNKPLIAHQGQTPGGTDDPVTEANTAFEQTPTITGNTSWYCHAPGPDLGMNDPKIVVQ
jgi:plastocyanin